MAFYTNFTPIPILRGQILLWIRWYIECNDKKNSRKSLSAWFIIQDEEVNADNEIVKKLQEHQLKHGHKYRKEVMAFQFIHCEQLVASGEASDYEDAQNKLRERAVKHRPSLAWCRSNAQKYIRQLYPQEYMGLFRMDIINCYYYFLYGLSFIQISHLFPFCVTR